MPKKKAHSSVWKEQRRLHALELERKGWKQKDIAIGLNVAKSAVSQWLKVAKERGTGNMLVDAGNEDTWTVRAATVDADLRNSPDGKTITINYRLDDTLDLRPDWTSGKRTGPSGLGYNIVTSFLGPVWDILGGNQNMKVYADWTTTVTEPLIIR